MNNKKYEEYNIEDILASLDDEESEVIDNSAQKFDEEELDIMSILEELDNTSNDGDEEEFDIMSILEELDNTSNDGKEELTFNSENSDEEKNEESLEELFDSFIKSIQDL